MLFLNLCKKPFQQAVFTYTPTSLYESQNLSAFINHLEEIKVIRMFLCKKSFKQIETILLVLLSLNKCYHNLIL